MPQVNGGCWLIQPRSAHLRRNTVRASTCTRSTTVSAGADWPPERDVRWTAQERASLTDERLNMRLLHVWPEEVVLASPALQQRDAGLVGVVLKNLDAFAGRLIRQ